MLTQIRRIKKLGVFDHYVPPTTNPPFKRYNIIYGENGSGKTTLSRLFASLEVGEHPDHPELEYEVESQSGSFTHGTKYTRRVRVFNSDYVEANVGRIDGLLRHILILGEENKAIAEELKVEIATRDDRNVRLQAIEAAEVKTENETGKLFSQIAKTIGEATSGSSLRSYRKPDAEAAFHKLTTLKPLSDGELEIYRATVRQDHMPKIALPELPTLARQSTISILETANNAARNVMALTLRSAQSAAVERLVKNPAIATWVEEGLHIHAGEPARCEFCDQPLTKERLELLASHFSLEDRLLKEELEAERETLKSIVEAWAALSFPDRLALYSELRSDFDKAVEAFQHEREQFNGQLGEATNALSEKITMRTTAYAVDLGSDCGALVSALEGIQAVLRRHNEKSDSFSEQRSKARAAIEAHYLQSIEQPVMELTKRAEVLRTEATLLRNGGEGLPDTRSLDSLVTSIAAKQAQVSSAHAGGEGLTRHLEQFLGRTELKFVSGDDGYRVLRRGRAAKHLSEGEKTAIAFLYFLVQLKDQNFELADGVVVIDDPISSLDASAIYQAFSFLKNETQAAKQLFILTHNFEFLRLLINWIKNIPGSKANRTFMMVLCSETESGRSARLTPLDSLLIEHATEYHYLFKVLYTFKSDGTILGCYHVPNIARKVLETFLDFHVPSSKNLHQKLEDVDFDPHRKTAIYKFANDLSHHTGKSFDPALVAEAQKNTQHLLDMIKSVAPLHFSGLEALSQR